MEWRRCSEFPSYEVSEFGDVRRCAPGIRGGFVGKVMKPYVREDGYRMYILREGNRSFHRKAHQLVAAEFVGAKPFPKAEVRHLDGTRTNDHFTNLAWGSSAENKADMLIHGTRKVGEASHHAKLTAKSVAEIVRRYKAGERQAALAQAFGVQQSTVSKIVRGYRWKHLSPPVVQSFLPGAAQNA